MSILYEPNAQIKMIKYVSQKQVDLQGKSLKQKQQSQELRPVKASPTVQTPQEELNSTKALRELKKINDHKQMLKGRLSVLQIQQEKNDFRAFLNDHRYNFHQQMRDEMQRQRQEKAMHLKRNYLQLLQSQEKARSQREGHRANLRQAQGELNQMKGNDYKTTKDKSEELERSLSMARQEEHSRKRQRKQEIREYEKSQRANVQEYLRNKMKQLKANDNQTVQKLSRVREERSKQIQELSMLESLMIEKQARSKMSSQESQKKLRLLLAQQKQEKALSTSHTTKLPALSPKRQQSEQDILIL